MAILITILYVLIKVCLCKSTMYTMKTTYCSVVLEFLQKRRLWAAKERHACVVSYLDTGNNNKRKERVCNTVIFRQLNRQIFTNGNMTRAYRQGEPVHRRLVYRV